MSALVLLSFGLVSARPRPPGQGDAVLHALVRALVRVLYRLRTVGLQHVPERGAALLVCNHVSFVDALVLAAASERPVRFVMHHRIHSTPILRRIFDRAGVIPIARAHEDPVLLERAFERIDEHLEAGELVCIFPEGKVTNHGRMNPFRTGVLRVLQRRPVPVVPMGLRGLWGSFFSRKHGPAMKSRPRRFRSRIELHCGPALSPESVDLLRLQARVADLAGQANPISPRKSSVMSR